jgi:predicted Ser/Thr protein kinase
MYCRSAFHEIELANLKELSEKEDNKIGEGTFGICSKKRYRGYVVCVKQFKDKSRRMDVEQEALMIQSFDHPGMSFGAILFLLIICTHVKIYV